MRTDTDGSLLHFSFVCRKFDADFELPGKSSNRTHTRLALHMSEYGANQALSREPFNLVAVGEAR
jgi:hypothetical protein